MAVEGAVIKPLRLQKHHGVGVFDGCDQQSLGVIGIGRDDHLQPADVGEKALPGSGCASARQNAPACRHSENDGAGEIAIRAIADTRRLLGDLIIGGIHVIGELDFDTGAQAISGHADGGADNAGFADRRIETAGLAVFS